MHGTQPNRLSYPTQHNVYVGQGACPCDIFLKKSVTNMSTVARCPSCMANLHHGLNRLRRFMLGTLGQVGGQAHGPQKSETSLSSELVAFRIGGLFQQSVRQTFPTGCDVTDFPRSSPQVCSRSGQAIPCSHRSLLPTSPNMYHIKWSHET